MQPKAIKLYRYRYLNITAPDLLKIIAVDWKKRSYVLTVSQIGPSAGWTTWTALGQLAHVASEIPR